MGWTGHTHGKQHVYGGGGGGGGRLGGPPPPPPPATSHDLLHFKDARPNAGTAIGPSRSDEPGVSPKSRRLIAAGQPWQKDGRTKHASVESSATRYARSRSTRRRRSTCMVMFQRRFQTARRRTRSSSLSLCRRSIESSSIARCGRRRHPEPSPWVPPPPPPPRSPPPPPPPPRRLRREDASEFIHQRCTMAPCAATALREIFLRARAARGVSEGAPEIAAVVRGILERLVPAAPPSSSTIGPNCPYPGRTRAS